MFLVHCQSVNATKTVEGVQGNSANFQWTVNKGNDKIASLVTFLGTGFNGSSTLFPWDITLKKPRGPSPFAKDLFGNRLNASVIGSVADDSSVIYQLKLDDLQLSDRGQTFYLHALFVNSAPSGGAITLVRVQGIYLLLFILFCLFFLS